MAPGPPPTPTNILRMRGSWRGKRNPNEPQPEREKPPRPKWLDRRAKAAWNLLIPELDRLGVLGRLDRNALARYCRLWSRWREAEEFVEKNGSTFPVRDKDGNIATIKRWPQVAIASDLADKLLRLEQCFGLNPSARTRLQVPSAPPVYSNKERFGKLG